uniref:CHK kinase-like domain-containing protein n=1 Tax=Anopheles culicifacies TaxID=139723 RepID=A0A182MGV9_9DIPT
MAGETNADSGVVQPTETSTEQLSAAAGAVELVEHSNAAQSEQTTKVEVQDEKQKEVSSEDGKVEQNTVVEPKQDDYKESVTEDQQESENDVMEKVASDVPTPNGAVANEATPAGPHEDEEVSSSDAPAYLHKAMEQVASEQGFTAGEYKLEFDVGSNKGDGFTGQMFKAFLTEGDRREVFLCKIPPLNEARRRQFNTMHSFARETLAYKTLLPRMFAYQEEKGVAREDGFFNVPKCYYAECDEATEESVIVMDDLRLMDYRMVDKMKSVNYEHARLTMQYLGRLHALSLALKRDHPEEFEQFKVPDSLSVMMQDQSPLEMMMKQMVNDAKETLEPHETKERAKMEKLFENMRQEMISCTDGTSAEPYTVLGHGDCWVNNFMYNYKNGAPATVIFLDWQITRYVSPVLDIAYFLFCCTDEEFRRRYFDEMISVYYNSLATLLEQLGHSPQEVFPRTALMRQLRRYGRFGILMAVFLVPMMCTRNEDLHDLDEAANKYQESNEIDLNTITTNANQSAYRTRMSSAIRDMNALASVAQKLGFISNQHLVDYDFRANKNNRSVVSIFYRVTFREEPREVTVLCKVPPPDADDTMLAMFEREVFVYGKLLPAFEVFQRTKWEGTPEGSAVEEEMLSFGPLCYHAHCDVKKGEGIIILEDVQRRGFTNRHKFEPMDYDHARLAMMQLGRFHATSLALKKQQPELFEQYRYMGDVTRERVLAMEGFEQAMEQAFESASATLNPGDVGRREKLARLRGSFAEELQNISDTALSEPFCVVCHGDYAGDNMMFSYNGGFPNWMVLLDWQLAKYGSPALDFVHTVFLSTDESFRRNHYDSMLQTYHNALVNHLERLGDDSATEWFPLTVLMRLVKLQARQALVLGMLHIPLTVASEEATALAEDETDESREDSSSVQISDTTDAKYQSRMAGLLKDIKSIDEDSGRVIVEFAIGKQTESLNECLIQLVPIGEYSKNSNVINTAKYEEFKERERYGAATSSSKDTEVKDSYSKRDSRRVSDNTNSSDDERERHRRKHKKSSSPYIRTSSGTKKKSHKYKQRREYRDERRGSSRDRRHRSPRSSGSESDDKFHKKKTKKKKRPRSRSRSRQ